MTMAMRGELSFFGAGLVAGSETPIKPSGSGQRPEPADSKKLNDLQILEIRFIISSIP
jgi:ribonuclease HIII